MKKILKSRVFAFILGAILFGGIGVVSAYGLFAKDVDFTPSDNTWKKETGDEITNVEDAVDELYKMIKNIKRNWTAVISYRVYLGWNGNTGYGYANGEITVKCVGGNVSVTNSGGVKNSPTDNWNGSYYINSKVTDVALKSFTYN